MKSLLRSAVLLVVLFSSFTGRAALVNKEAERLFELGGDHARKQRFGEAVVFYRQSMAKEPALDTLIRIAWCESMVGQLLNAIRHYRDVLSSSHATDDDRNFARKQITEIETRLPHIVLRTSTSPAPPGRVVRLDDVDLSPSELNTHIKVDPGSHRIVATAPNHDNLNETIWLEEGKKREINIDLKPSVPAQRFRNGLGVIAGSGVVALVGTGLVLGTGLEDYGGGTSLDTDNVRKAGVVTIAVGLTGVAMGLIYVIEFGSDKQKSQVAFLPYSNGPGMSMVGSF